MNSLKEIADFIIHQWMIISGIAGVIAALSVFVQNLFTIQKLTIEISNLKKADNEKKKIIYVATVDEVKAFGYPHMPKKDTDIRYSLEPVEFKKLVPRCRNLFMWLGLIVSAAVVLYLSSGGIYSLTVFLTAYSITRFLIFWFGLNRSLEDKIDNLFDEFMSQFPDQAIDTAEGWVTAGSSQFTSG